MGEPGMRGWPAAALATTNLGGREFYADAPASIPGLLEQHEGTNTALILEGPNERRVSYRELLERSFLLAGALQQRYQVVPKERVGLLFANGIEFCVALFGTLLCGGVAVPLSTKLAGPELADRLTDCGARVLLGDGEWWPKLAPYREQTQLEHVALVNADEEDPFEELENPGFSRPPADPNAPALLVYTSGTTGAAKGAVLSHQNVVQAAETYVRCLGLGEEDTTLIAVPIFHVTGLDGQLLPMLRAGGQVRILPRFDASETATHLIRGDTTFFHAAPSIYLLVLDAARAQRARGLRLALCGGGPISPASIEEVLRFAPGVDFRTVYGLTETSSPATLMPAQCLHERPGSSGVAVPVDEVRIDASPGEDGEILVRGATVASGYFGQTSATATVFEDGWLHTGDLGHLDDEGFLYIVDRLKDMINRGGEKISSLEVERALYEHPSVLECAVVAKSDPLLGEVPIAYVVAKGALDQAELRQHAIDRLAKFEVPVDFLFVNELPHNEAGKVLKTTLRSRG